MSILGPPVFPLARVLPPRPPTLIEHLRDAVEALQQHAPDDWTAASDYELGRRVGALETLLAVLDLLPTNAEANV